MQLRGGPTAAGAVAVLTFGFSACGASHRTVQRAVATTTVASSSTTSAPTTTSTRATTIPTVTVPTTSAVRPQSPTPAVTIAHWTGREPVTIYFSADGGNIATDLRWSHWDTQGAVANGIWHYLNCQPNCASGTATPYPVTITLSDPVVGQFTKLIEHTSGPHGFTTMFTAPQLGQGACTNQNNDSCAFS